MSNSWFQFKQFRVQQDRCAMKVSTDACIQGAWTPVAKGVRNVLDIGTGTGLLSLMLAQRNNDIYIDAIELDETAAMQARENMEASPWRGRIKVFQGDVRIFPFDKQYDMVICNPPFFNNSLLGDSEERNNARHTLSLAYEDLLDVLSKVLMPEGYASILLPYAEHQQWEMLLEKNGWGINRKLLVQPRSGSLPNRVVSICTKDSQQAVTEGLIIYEGQHEYTAEAKELLKAFYLRL